MHGRRPTRPRRPAAALTAAALAAGVPALGACASTPQVGQEHLEREVTTQLTEMAGRAPDDVECPEEGLEGEVGRTQRCVLTAGPDRLGLTVTVTEVEGERVRFDIEVDEEPMQ